MGCDGVVNFIYIEKGGMVLEYIYCGFEMILVINGEFFDGLNDYDFGDLIYMIGEYIYVFCFDVFEGCLVFSVVD